MSRKLGTFQGSLSMAVSWIWAPAIFICSLQSYQQGLPGIFWFTLPNIICFFVFIPIALKMKKEMPSGYTISQVFKYKFPNTKLPHKASLVVTLGYQLGAIVINCVAGATLISLLAGIPYSYGVVMMATVSLVYSLISGLRASVISDMIQMIMILGIGFFLIPWVVIEAGGFEAITNGIGGVTGQFNDLFDPVVAFSFGIATTIGLISGPVADQMFSQRAHAAKKGSLKKIFIYGGLLFGIVPITLSLLGFVGASEVMNGNIEVTDPQMVGPIVIDHFLPKWGLILFALMAFSGLTSTLDSAFCAVGSLISVDLKENALLPKCDTITLARIGMVFFAVVGVSIALLQPKLLWVFLIYGALAASIFLPTFLTLFWRRTTAKAISLGIIIGFLVATPLSIYANVIGNTNLIVLSAILGLTLSGLIVSIVSVKN
nr:hypothetical protein [Flagellimonas sp. S3867]